MLTLFPHGVKQSSSSSSSPSPRKIFPSHLLLRRLTAGPAEFGLFRPRPVGDAISIAPRTRSLRPLVRCIGAPRLAVFRTSLQ